MTTDILIAGSGCSGLYCALHLPESQRVTVITKSDCESNDSFLAQGGMCMLTGEGDYQAFFADTMAAGHDENDPHTVELMIRGSRAVVDELLSLGVRFAKGEDGRLLYTKEGAHSANRIVFHKDITGKEITSHLLEEARKRANITILEYTTLLDIIESQGECKGAVIRRSDGQVEAIKAKTVVLATGGVGGVYRHSTNFRHLTGDAVAIALKHGIKLRDITYVQIHPTTLYREDPEDRSFLISESMRGEGALLYDKNGNRFVDELLPRDKVTDAILAQMKKDGTEHVWEDLSKIPQEELLSHFPNIVAHCKEAGYDVTKEWIPVVPAQHYFMGGIRVNYESKTSMESLYAVGECACNGVHGKNRLASNSLLESLVFARRAAADIAKNLARDEAIKAVDLNAEAKGALVETYEDELPSIDLEAYADAASLEKEYYDLVVKAVKEGENV